MYITLDEAKKHLNVEKEYTEDDTLIEMYIDVAEAKVAKELCVTVEGLAEIDGGESIPYPIKQAILLNVGMYYANREELTYTQSKPLEQGSKYLLSLYRDYTL
ncbi:head-tail connector protein [Phocaeicola coprocola]|jgi:hypothetical protein|uniref:head-tail connector protein n=1 Tax=Phocaeicola coprocola TaxID=310298 RepID=UPI0039F5EA2A